MAKGKHISPEDIADIFDNEKNITKVDEEMLTVLQHLASCKECLERIRAHRRLELLLLSWTPELHGQAFRKNEALKELEKSRNGGKADDSGAAEDDSNELAVDDAEDYDQYDDDEHVCAHDSDEACDCGSDCGCGHDHDHKYFRN